MLKRKSFFATISDEEWRNKYQKIAESYDNPISFYDLPPVQIKLPPNSVKQLHDKLENTLQSLRIQNHLKVIKSAKAEANNNDCQTPYRLVP